MKDVTNKNTDCENVLLVASFGTTSAESRRLDIAPVEEAIKAAAGREWNVRRCFSSHMVIDIIEKREGIRTDSIEGAIEKALSEGASRLAVQPTHLMKGLEYEKLKRVLDGHAGLFECTSLGDPLLASEEDLVRVADALIEASTGYDDGETALVFMGHGTDAASNRVYTELQSILVKKRKTAYYIGTAEAEPSLDDVIDAVAAGRYRRVAIRPLMLVAGNHALNDMASPDDPDSWYSRFTAAGYDTICIKEGLGRIPAIRDIYGAHAAKAVRSTRL